MHKFITHKKENFTMIDNSLIKDPSVSAKSKAIIIYLLSKPKEWNASVKDISKHFTDGVDSVKTALKELEKHFYLYREKSRNKEGLFITTYNIYEDPKTNPKNRNWYLKPVQSGKSIPDQSGFTITDNPQINNTIPSNTKKLYKKEFEEWWNLYNKKTTKKQTIIWWNRNITEELLKTIMEHTKRYVKAKEKVWRLDPVRYFKFEEWENELIEQPLTLKEREEQIDREAEDRQQKIIDKQNKYMEQAQKDACSDEERRKALNGGKRI